MTYYFKNNLISTLIPYLKNKHLLNYSFKYWVKSRKLNLTFILKYN